MSSRLLARSSRSSDFWSVVSDLWAFSKSVLFFRNTFGMDLWLKSHFIWTISLCAVLFTVASRALPVPSWFSDIFVLHFCFFLTVPCFAHSLVELCPIYWMAFIQYLSVIFDTKNISNLSKSFWVLILLSTIFTITR